MASHPQKDSAITVRLERSESEQLDAIAAREREARSVIVRRLIRIGLDQTERRGDPSAPKAA